MSMGTGPSQKRFTRLRIDADVLIINYVGIPLSGQLSKFARDKYPLLRDAGPNDGLTLLTDAIAPKTQWSPSDAIISSRRIKDQCENPRP